MRALRAPTFGPGPCLPGARRRPETRRNCQRAWEPVHMQTARHTEPQRAAPGGRHAPDTRRTFHKTPETTRSAPGRAVQTQWWHAAPEKGATSPEAAVQGPPLHDTRAQSTSAAVRAPRQLVHAHKLLAGVCTYPGAAAPSPKEPRRATGTPRHAPRFLRAARTTRNTTRSVSV
jgi:hypothetical protein